MKRTWLAVLIVGLLSGWAMAQAAPQPNPQPDNNAAPVAQAKRPGHTERREIRIVSRSQGDRDDVFYIRRGGMGRWWKDAQLVKELGLNDAQVQQIEKIFLDTRLKLVDLKGNLEKAEIQLDPMMNAAQPDETAVLAQIDKVAAARAELEKANARMQFAIRRVLNADQWQKLQSKQAERGPMMRHFELPVPPPGAPDPPEPPEPPDMD